MDDEAMRWGDAMDDEAMRWGDGNIKLICILVSANSSTYEITLIEKSMFRQF